MNTFQLRILGAHGTFYQGECQSLSLPTSSGQYGILAHHCNMIAAIVPGLLIFQAPGQEEPQTAAISTGLLKVEDNQVLIFADTIERPEEIDFNRARRAAEAAQEAILKRKSMLEYRSAQSNLAREVNRLRAKKRFDTKFS